MLCSGKTASMNRAIRCHARNILTNTSSSLLVGSRRLPVSRSTTTRRSYSSNHAGSHPRPLLKKKKNNEAFTWQQASRPPTTVAFSVTTGSALWDTVLPNAIAAALKGPRSTSCEALVTAKCDQHAMVSYHPTVPAKIKSSSSSSSWLRRACRMVLRFIKLAVTLAPVVAFYPILLWTNPNSNQDAQDVVLAGYGNGGNGDTGPPPVRLLAWYLNLCLTCVECSGAAVIKLMQWAGSRPDMFGNDFCSVFARLQDDTTPHSWKHTQRAMRQAYGKDWQSYIRLHEIIGSGCIGQVYRGHVLRVPPPPTNANNSNNALVSASHQPQQQVAVKVLHPNVEQDIDADLDLMRCAVRVIQWFPFAQGFKWLDLEGIVEEFAVLLKEQLDLRNEAANLQRFHQNFDSTTTTTNSSNKVNVVFPHLVPGFAPSRQVLVETFCDGIPVLEFARQHKDDRAMLSHMCRAAISAVCKMIFLDNFMHGDLHPGDVFVSRDGKNFILFDVGIVAEYTNEDHAAIVSILAEFIRKNGRKAGAIMIDDSNRRLQKESSNDAQELQQHALQVETFLTKIEYLTIQASGKNYFMQKLGEYISYICQAAATHHVKLNPSFISAALAVKVEEGIALALDPSVEIWRVATPIIIESETRRRLGNRLRGGGSTSTSNKKKDTPPASGDATGDSVNAIDDDSNKDSSYLEAALRLLRGEK